MGQLREATRTDHLAVEALLPLQDAEQLIWGLSAMLGLFGPLELRLLELLGGDFVGRERAPRMQADLRALGQQDSVRWAGPAELPELRTHSEGVGALYVLEGSLMGAPHVARRLAARGLRASCFEVPADEIERRWRETRALIERAEADEVLRGASATFRALRGWLEDRGDCRCTIVSHG